MRPRSLTAGVGAVLALVVLVGCAPEDEVVSETACPVLDSIVRSVEMLGADPDATTPASTELAMAYGVLAGEYRSLADVLTDDAAAASADRMADVLADAADAVERLEIEDRDELVAAMAEQPEVAEMATHVNANLPLGLDPATTDELIEECDPDLSGLTQPEVDGPGVWPDPAADPTA